MIRVSLNVLKLCHWRRFWARIYVVCVQLERVLGSEQRRSDFMPRDDVLSFDRPTSACLLGTALLSALGGAAKDTLEGNNQRLFLTEVRGISRATAGPTGGLGAQMECPAAT